MKMLSQVFIFVLMATISNATYGFQNDGNISLRIMTWNVEGNGQTDPALIEQQLSDKDGVDLLGLVEVRERYFDRYCNAAAVGEGGAFKIIKGNSGGRNLKMAIIYNPRVLNLIGTPGELRMLALNPGLRASLYARFKGVKSGQEFIFMVNHLKCCSNGLAKRKRQCKLISQWAKNQNVPVIMAGDLNAPTQILAGQTAGAPGEAIDELVKNGPFIWFQPDKVFKTQSSRRYNTVLDYIMVANSQGLSADWDFKARILNRGGDSEVTVNSFQDSTSTADHRPVDVILTKRSTPNPIVDDPTTPNVDPGTQETLEQRVRNLEEKIDRILQMLEDR